MRDLFPMMLDRPETPNVAGSVAYCILAFWSLPFILLLFMMDSFQRPTALCWSEIAYHIINFIVAVAIFRPYLAESFLNVQADLKNVMYVSLTAAGMMCAVILFYLIAYMIVGSEDLYLAALGTLPITEMDLFTLTSDVIRLIPLYGTLCMSILVPVSTSCLYYATAFAPACCKKTWLGYVVVAVFIAIPRIFNAVTFWDPGEQFRLYLMQLPMHLFACWAYQKADTVWAPIFSLSATNILSCLVIHYLF